MCLKCESASRRFQPGEGPSRGLLRDCENLLWNQWSTTQHYLDELDGEERADGVQVLRHQTQHVVGQQIVARVPQPEVVVLKQELVVRLGHVVKVSNVLFIELTFKKTLQKLSLILLGFHSTSLVFRF